MQESEIATTDHHQPDMNNVYSASNTNHDINNVVVSIEDLIDQQRWDDAYEEFQQHPEEAKRIVDPNSRLSWTYLHWLCSIPNAPEYLIEHVASIYPNAVIMPDSRYGDTPLHIVCRNSQIHSNRVRTLLRYCPTSSSSTTTTIKNNSPFNHNHSENPLNAIHQRKQQQEVEDDTKTTIIAPSLQLSDLLTRNIFGGTVLHSACNHNATLDTLQALVVANPNILRIRTREGVHAISALWTAYFQTIPGTMAVARILKYDDHINLTAILDHDSYIQFDRFWKKVEFLATEYYFLTQQQKHGDELPSGSNDIAATHVNDDTASSSSRITDRHMYVLHGLLRCDVPINMYKVALKVNPNYARVFDPLTHNYPLHVILENRPYRLKEKEAIIATIQAAPEITGIRNHNHDTPLLIGIRNKIPWDNGIDIIVNTHVDTVYEKQYVTKLYPFQYAALQGGKVAAETTYQLLCKRPDLVSADSK